MRILEQMVVPMAAAVAIAATGIAAGEEQDVKFSECPAAVRKALREEARGEQLDDVIKETEGGRTTYWGNVVLEGRSYAIGVAEDGTLTEVSLQVDDDQVELADCPEAVRERFEDEAEDVKIDRVTKDRKLGAVVFGTVVALDGKDYEIVVAEDGTLVEKSLVIKEDDVELADCPEPVREALRRESQGGRVGDVSRSSGIGGPVFEARVEVRGKGYAVEVFGDGKLISKTLDED